MKISIITVCYQREQTIAQAIESVLEQDYSDLEYLIIDGASKDRTAEIARSYAGAFAQRGIEYRVISEPDGGIYDAINKGIRLARGELIGLLHSDDRYAQKRVLSIVAERFRQHPTDSIYGNLLYVKNGQPYRDWRSGPPQSFKWGWMPPHPCFFVTRNCYQQYGLYRLDCGVNADYELMLRYLEVKKISTQWIDCVFTCMSVGGASSGSWRARLEALRNDRRAWKVNGLTPRTYSILLKKLRKIPQYLRAPFTEMPQ